MKFSPDSVMLIKEIGALVGNQEGTLKVLLAPPQGRDLSGVQSVDLAEGDEVGMAAGERILLVSELRELYESAEVGSEFKLGVRRSGKPIVVTFTKKDPEEMGSGGMMMIRREGPEQEGSSLFPALGFRLKEETGGLTVTEVLPEGALEVNAGDHILSLNGNKTQTLEEFESVLAAIEVGKAMKLLVKRGGKDLTLNAPRPEPKGTILKVK